MIRLLCTFCVVRVTSAFYAEIRPNSVEFRRKFLRIIDQHDHFDFNGSQTRPSISDCITIRGEQPSTRHTCK